MNSELIDNAFLKSDLVSCIDYDVLNYKECLNKFAELIIRECAKAYHKTRLSETPIETHFRNHFGIEE